MSEKRWTDDERSEAFERGLKTMEGVALELYRRGREPLLEELETVKRERDEARAELSKLRKDYDSVLEANVGLLDGAPYVDARAAFRRGAEAMREACAVALMSDGLVLSRERAANVVRALPIPEEP